MYADADQKLTDILVLVAKCPEKLQERCFEMLLEAYLASKAAPPPTASAPNAAGSHMPLSPPPQPAGPYAGVTLPDALRSRFAALAGRMGVQVDQVAALFDFNLDPYNYHALAVPGDNKADRSRNVGLLLCAKSYLTLSGWTADWKEFRAVCLDQGCWDQANVGLNLKKLGYFKVYSAAEGLTLSNGGVEAAEQLIAKLAGAENANPLK